MPRLTRWFIKTALVYFTAALIIALAISLRGPLRLPPSIGVLRAVYLHMFFVGWITQMIFGVAYWMFPRASRARPRGSEALGWGAYLTLNAGLLLRVIFEPLQALGSVSGVGRLLVAAATLQWLSGLLFVINVWGRVKQK